MRFNILFLLLLFILAACGGETPTEESIEPEEERPAVNFRNLDMEVEDIIFMLTGEVQTTEQTLFYIVMQGEETLLGEQAVEISSDDEWVSFEIADELSDEAREGEDSPILTLYGKSNDGQQINPNYIPIDIGIR